MGVWASDHLKVISHLFLLRLPVVEFLTTLWHDEVKRRAQSKRRLRLPQAPSIPPRRWEASTSASISSSIRPARLPHSQAATCPLHASGPARARRRRPQGATPAGAGEHPTRRLTELSEVASAEVGQLTSSSVSRCTPPASAPARTPTNTRASGAPAGWRGRPGRGGDAGGRSLNPLSPTKTIICPRRAAFFCAGPRRCVQ